MKRRGFLAAVAGFLLAPLAPIRERLKCRRGGRIILEPGRPVPPAENAFHPINGTMWLWDGVGWQKFAYQVGNQDLLGDLDGNTYPIA